MTETAVVDEGIRVVVLPSQASYFAGEPFSVTVTITNIRAAETTLPSRSASQSASRVHRRGAHSVSYVPMARPPTSPGIRTAMSSGPSRPLDGEAMVRRGVIGQPLLTKGAETQPDLVDPTRRRVTLNKSLSVSITTHDFRSDSQDDPKGKSPLRALQAEESAYSSPTSPRVSSPLARSATVPVNHPHARKHSVLDGQAQVMPTPNPSISTFSLALDPISEGALSPLPPATPVIPSPIPDSNNVLLRAQIPPSSSVVNEHIHSSRHPSASRKAQPALGHGLPAASAKRQTRGASSKFAVPNTELVLYSYAQLVGSLSISPLPDSVPTPEQIRTLNSVRQRLLRKKAVGGGSMDIASRTPHSPPFLSSSSRRNSHNRSSSLSVGLLSLLSPSSLMPSSPIPPSQSSFTSSRHARSPSMFSGLFLSSTSTTNVNGLGLSINSTVEEEPIDPETPLPTFEVQPTMLAVDLTLGPGESHSYTYALELPKNLPPTYRGRTLRLSYEFILGICRATPPSSTGTSSNSRVIKVPIRLYNHVVVGRPPSPYDLLWPITSPGRRLPRQSTDAVVKETRGLVRSVNGIQHNLSKGFELDSTNGDLRRYMESLLASASTKARVNGGAASGEPSDIRIPAWAYRNGDGLLYSEDELQEKETSCREAVDVLTRNPKKLSYDVNKDGTKVAVLTFTKSAYRLGETVLGVVELNWRPSRARVLKLSALLESHESLPASISPSILSVSRQTRRVHAEHHSSFVGNTLRTTFSLDVPSDASPTFQIDVSSGDSNSSIQSSPGGLEWKVRLCLLVAVASPNAQQGSDGVKLKHLIRDGPRGEWGTAWKAASTIAPSERPALLVSPTDTTLKETQSWTSFFTSAFFGASEPGTQYHDGDEDVAGLDDEEELEAGVGAEEDWREVKVEMVECEVPIKVWPGNTAFKATEVVFEV